MTMTMHDMQRRLGAGANSDPLRKLLRGASTAATNAYGLGGRPKTLRKPKPVTMPRLRCLEASADDDTVDR